MPAVTATARQHVWEVLWSSLLMSTGPLARDMARTCLKTLPLRCSGSRAPGLFTERHW